QVDADGDRIARATIESGFLHKGLEKSFERRSWFTAMTVADRVDSETALSAEMALAIAVEEICNIQVPRRAQVIRLILCELERVGSHLAFLARVSLATGFETASHYILRERELVLDLLELMTGRRFNPNFFRFG